MVKHPREDPEVEQISLKGEGEAKLQAKQMKRVGTTQIDKAVECSKLRRSARFATSTS